MALGKEFIGLVPPRDQKKPGDLTANPVGLKSFLRDQFSITTWLCLGAIAQGGLFLAAGRLALVPAVLLVMYRIFVAYAQSIGWMHNPLMDGVLMKKFSAQIPDSNGNYGTKPADSEIVVFLIGTRCNSSLGLLGHGFKQLGDYFDAMLAVLDAKPDDYGFLGMTRWLNSADRETGSESLSVCYFRTIEGLHKFAHDSAHREGWDWWNKDYQKMPHISIYHEIYSVPKGNWESIYINSHLSGINSTKFKITDMEGKEKWASPVVDASKGLLKTSAGRMSRSQAGEHEKMGVVDPY
ncbi:hypothetical protein LTR78_002223 [Recurvomyces mirabilis]|uniref:Monooxygenase n=1 Tax=Recurvomyces mirabilis TaxID=574656 RepID=A0AAE0WU76_9PEZI|nr:hypothetical protein LTR78_002223 [Recurvomyces mirabilis]KAK5160679.1 hypothetical protein LTS14_001691 [Recurvomyces mirabilis]